MKTSIEHSRLGPREVQPLAMTAQDSSDYAALSALGINLRPTMVAAMAQAYGFAMDDNQALITTASIGTPVQFLQTWLPGFVRTITAARKIDELIGISTVGSWEDEEVVQGVLEPTGNAVLYGDSTNVPLASWNVNFERRTVVRFEKGFAVGMLEEARASRMRLSTAAEKRAAAAVSLEIQRNLVGFNGFNNGANRTYGFLNDPALPAYVSAPTGNWATGTFISITADIRVGMAALQNQSQDNINPEDVNTTLALPTAIYQYLSVVNTQGNLSVREWMRQTYPKCRIVSAPQLNQANGGANVYYLYAEAVEDGASDDSRTWVQVVPSKFMTLGVQKRAKDYVEDFANATAGVMLKRPYAVVRYTGL
ncbi:MAG: DUF2184 domain-containing protein [Bradyrhizobium sp.]|nr:DUF2184 domain-containing protein [Bradyrhizobium sp.]